MAIPPPPYSNIAGTSAIVGKYNQQETIAEADGNARPGQLVVNLATDPPELYIGNNAGNLTLVTGGGGGNASLPLANGTSNFDIATANGNVTITANTTETWTFSDDGRIFLPNGGVINNNGNNIDITSGDDISLEAANRVNIYTDTAGSGYQWQFESTGELIFPGGNSAIIPDTFFGTTAFKAASNTAISLVAEGNGSGLLLWGNDFNDFGNSTYGFVAINNPSSPGNVQISLSDNSTGISYNWFFAPDGNIVAQSLVSPGGNPGSMQWLGNSSGDGSGYTTLQLRPDDTLVGLDQYLILDPTGPGHIHLRAGGVQDNSTADLFIGGENSYFKIAAGSNSAVSVASNSFVWTFDTDGNLQTAGNLNVNIVNANSITSSSNVNVGNVQVGTGSGGSLTGANLISANFYLTSYSNTVSANGSDQAGATLLTSTINEVISVNTGEGVRLPALEATVFYIINNTGNTLEVYPESGAQINLLGLNANFTQSANSTMQFISTANTQWWTIGAN